ncbi:MAG: thioredoxin [Lachnospiraceae bacterium]|jgi:thioredoxin 1|nr:thioredoxin [Lachnospiraceae bacterium]
MAELKITGKEFNQEIIQSSTPVLVDFYADWCGPCKMLSPVISQIAEEHEDGLKVVKVNVDEAQDLAIKFQIRSIPTLMYFQEGKVKGTSLGLLDKESLERKLLEWGGK